MIEDGESATASSTRSSRTVRSSRSPRSSRTATRNQLPRSSTCTRRSSSACICRTSSASTLRQRPSSRPRKRRSGVGPARLPAVSRQDGDHPVHDGLPRGLQAVLADRSDVRVRVQGPIVQPPAPPRGPGDVVPGAEGLHHGPVAAPRRTLGDPRCAPGDLRRRVLQGLRQRAVGLLVRAARVPGRRDAGDRPAPPGPRRPRPAVPHAAAAPRGPGHDHEAGARDAGPTRPRSVPSSARR